MKTNGFNSIKVGTKIIYRPSWGTGALTKVKVRNIELCKNEGDKYGERVSEVSVNDVNRSIFDLDDGHWCYGYQVEEITQHAENMSDKYIVVGWPESQDLMELEGFEDNSYLINDEQGISDFGYSAYFVSEDWLNTIIK